MTKSEHFYRTYKNLVENSYFLKIENKWFRYCGSYSEFKERENYPTYRKYYSQLEDSPNGFLEKLNSVERKLKLEKLLKS